MESLSCALCDKSASLKCSKCLIVSYCTQECQKNHWKTHKKTCNKPKESVPISDEVMTMLNNDDVTSLKAALKDGVVDVESVSIQTIKVKTTETMNLFTCACVANATEITRYLMSIHQYNLNAIEIAHGSTVLMDACSKGRIDLALLLISYGANTIILNTHGVGAFDMIGRGSKSKLSKSAVAEFLQRCQDALVKYTGSTTITNKNKCVVCQAPATNKCSKCDNVYYCSTEHQSEDWRTHKANCIPSNREAGTRIDLRNAVACKDIGKVTQLIDKHPQFLNDIRSPVNKSPLHVAACHGHTKIVKLLLDKGANVDLLEKEGCTPLMFACQFGYVGVVKLLLNANADMSVYHNKYGNTALMMASEHGHSLVVTMLLQAGADANYLSNVDGGSALLAASLRNNVDVVRVLLGSGADINIRMKNGVSALMMATFKGHTEIVKVLLESHADVTLRDEHGRSALMAKKIAFLLMAKY